MPIGGGQQTNWHQVDNEVDVNTDDLQKLIMGTDDENKKKASAEFKRVEPKTPIQQIIQGEDQTAKKDLLKNFIQKVASKGMEVFSDKGRRDTKSISEVKLLFGDDGLKADEVSISAEARMDELKTSVAESSSRVTSSSSSEEVDLEARENFETDLYTEKTDARNEVELIDDSDSSSIDDILDGDGDVELEPDSLDMPEFDDEGALITRNERDGDRGDQRGNDSDDQVHLEESIEEQIEAEGEVEDADVETADGVKKAYGDEELDEELEDLEGEAEEMDQDFFDEDLELDKFRVGRDARGSKDRGDQRGDDSEKQVRVIEARDDQLVEIDEDEDDLLDEDELGVGKSKSKKKSSKSSQTKRVGGIESHYGDQEEAPTEDEDLLVNLQSDKKKLADLDGEEDGVESDLMEVDVDEMEEGEDDSVDFDDLDEEGIEEDEIEKAAGGRIRTNAAGGNSADDSDGDDSSDRDIVERQSEKVAEEKITKTELLEKYTDNYRKYLLNPKKNYLELKADEEMLLKEFGITSRQLKDMQMTIRNNIKMEVRESVKDSILQKQLSALSKFDSVSADAKLNQFTDYFTSNILMGGADFGNFDDNFQGLVNKAMYLASKDLANFAIGELEDFVMSESLDSSLSKADKIKSFEAKVQELNSITNNPKITEEWAQAAMEAFMKNYGLSKEDVDLRKGETSGINVNVETGAGDSSGKQDQKREKHGYEFDADDERGIFINRLRALYLQRALNPGLRTTLDTEFKIRKLKNGLLKMGVYTDVLNTDIQEEANEVAKERLMQMLEEALQERASLYDLRGSAYQLIEDKIKSILKNGEKVGLDLDKIEFNKIRDKVNYEMYEVTKKEMEMIGVRLSDEDLPALVVKYREMKKLIERLSEESGFDANVSGHEALERITIAETA